MNPTTIFNVIQWIEQLDRLCKTNRCNSPTFLRPHHFVTLALSLWRTGYYKLQVPPALQAYAARMRLWDSIGMDAPVVVKERDTNGRFVPLVRLDDRSMVEETATQLARIAKEYGADEATYSSLQISMMEIIGNCFAHSEVPDVLKGLACAQSWPQGDLAQIAIADTGIGIRKTLEANPDLRDQLDAENSCEIATQFGITSKPGKGHAGYGLALTRQLLANAGGRLLVLSSNEWFASNGMKFACGDLRMPWEGTVVVLEWNTRRPLRTQQVYETWPLPEGYVEDDFNFED